MKKQGARKIPDELSSRAVVMSVQTEKVYLTRLVNEPSKLQYFGILLILDESCHQDHSR